MFYAFKAASLDSMTQVVHCLSDKLPFLLLEHDSGFVEEQQYASSFSDMNLRLIRDSHNVVQTD